MLSRQQERQRFGDVRQIGRLDLDRLRRLLSGNLLG
jgi:hypothetical protein